MDPNQLKYPLWQVPLQDVMQEFSRDKLPVKIQKVEALIFERLQQLQSSNDGAAERFAISEALELLRTVKHNRLEYPDWN
jgi:hypothetical protein